MTAALTMGTRAMPGTSWPSPSPSHQWATPSAAANPKALPPVRITAVGPAGPASGSSSASSRVLGPPPRTSTPPTVPAGGITTVHPVPATASVQCPTRTPATSPTPIVVVTLTPAGTVGRRTSRAGRP